jgi:iron complex transport system substrate-binding protein
VTTDAGRVAPRVVSLLPAATEIVAALGGLRQLVGITHECDHPAETASIPRVTTSEVDRDASSAAIDAAVRELSSTGAPVFGLDSMLLAELAPDVVLTQSLCDVCAFPDGEVDRAIAELRSPPRVLSLGATTLDAVWADVRHVGDAIGRREEADALLASLDERMRRVHESLKAVRAPRPRVAVIEWLDPIFVAGHWSPELVRRAGGVDVLDMPGAHSVQSSVQAVRESAPDILLFAPCGFDVERAEREARALLASEAWEWARSLECWALDGNSLTSRPGPRLVDAIETIAALFAPSLFAAPHPRYARLVTAPMGESVDADAIRP